MIYFGTLLWIDEKNHSAVNNKNKSIVSYYRQVDLLAKTLRFNLKSDLFVFTNEKKKLEKWFQKSKKQAPQFVPISSEMVIPDGTRFYSAHHKLDAIASACDLLNNPDDIFILLDSDVISLGLLNMRQCDLLNNADLVVYDISDQVFHKDGESKSKPKKDLEFLANTTLPSAKWFGGEFLAGNKIGLMRLVEMARSLLPRYFANLDGFGHKGDEMFVSASLNLLLKEKQLRILDQNDYFLASRHWARWTNPPLSHHMKYNFIHCPGSKPALEFLSLFSHPKTSRIYRVLRSYQMLVIAYQVLKRTRLR